MAASKCCTLNPTGLSYIGTQHGPSTEAFAVSSFLSEWSIVECKTRVMHRRVYLCPS